jgi:hypothetical protein
MKKINVLLVAAIAIILFSCGNGKGTKNENNQDSTAISKIQDSINNESKVSENNLVSMSFLELNNQLRDNFKNFANEYDGKFLILSDLLVYKCSWDNQKEKADLSGYPYDTKEKKLYADTRWKEVMKFNGKIIEIEKDENKYFCPGIYDNIFKVTLINKNQLKNLKIYDGIKDNNFEDLIKVKTKLEILDRCNIMFHDAEIIK